ncbi:MAG: hypothetical protein AB7F22_05185 [Reyranella sp.]|uniref:hypothetical protein n=1 Tax=Reyranella sp. TaxID=1929291 RepID=UPI003D0D20D7
MNESDTPAKVGSSEGLGLVMRNVRRLQRHMDEWTRWYGATDVLLRHQLPLPPAGTVRVLEDLEDAIRAAKQPAATALTDEQVAEFGALCVMNRRSNKTVRELLAEYKAELGIGA